MRVYHKIFNGGKEGRFIRYNMTCGGRYLFL